MTPGLGRFHWTFVLKRPLELNESTRKRKRTWNMQFMNQCDKLGSSAQQTERRTGASWHEGNFLAVSDHDERFDNTKA